MNRTIHYNPSLNRIFAALQPSIFADTADAPAANGFFRVDIEESADAYRISADLPGVKKDAISINVEDQVLKIGAEFSRQAETQEKPEQQENGKTLRRERMSGSATREFQLPPTVQSENISAALDNGVLTVTLPKSENNRQRKVSIA